MSLIPDLNQSPFLLLDKMKLKIEKKIGKPVDSFSMGVDCLKKELQFHVEGYPSEITKDPMSVFVIKKALKMTLGKNTPDFNKCMIAYQGNFIHIAFAAKDGSITTKSVNKSEEGSIQNLLKEKFA